MDVEQVKADLKAMTQDELRVLVKLIDNRADTYLHEASHAVVAVHLGLLFDYVTALPQVNDEGNILLGHVHWADRIKQAIEQAIKQDTRDAIEPYAIAVIAPQAALPLLSVSLSDEEFSEDNLLINVFLRFRQVTLSHLMATAEAIVSQPPILKAIRTVADGLRDSETLTLADVQRLYQETLNT